MRPLSFLACAAALLLIPAARADEMDRDVPAPVAPQASAVAVPVGGSELDQEAPDQSHWRRFRFGLGLGWGCGWGYRPWGGLYCGWGYRPWYGYYGGGWAYRPWYGYYGFSYYHPWGGFCY